MKTIPTLVDPLLPWDLSIRRIGYTNEIERDSIKWMSDDEMERLSSISHEKRRRAFLLGRVAARSLLGDVMNIEPTQVHLRVTPEGPVVAPDTPYHLSIAHTGDEAAAVIGKRRVGLDLERIVERPDRMLPYILHDDELAHVESLPLSTTEKIILCWSLKEAVLKGTGTGLRRSPKRIHLDIAFEDGTARIQDTEGAEWRACFEMTESAILAVAWELRTIAD